jgi:crotonobetainyl-CoA:carnitine CoA-transferase CaiB-like acyl-CoA transferase
MRQLLSDIRVVELSDEPAGAYCGKVFADLGAEVVRLEAPTGGELRERPGAWLYLATNKRSVLIEPGQAVDQEAVQRLLAAADLVVESPQRGDLAGIGVDRSELQSRHPQLVIASVSGFGVAGPYSAYRWSDLVVQTAAWFTLPQGRTASVPLKHPGLVAMCTLGHTLACGALAAVRQARDTGIGAHVDCAAYEALATGPSRIGRFLGWEYRDRTREAQMPARFDGVLFPTGIFPCGDGFVSLMSTPQQLTEMLTVLDDEALTEAFSRPDAFVRPETKEILDAALYPWLLSHTREELTAIAQAAQWPFGYVNSLAEVLAADHLHQRGYWSEVDGPSGPVRMPGPPYRHAEGGWRLHWPGPPRGGPVRTAPNLVGTTAADRRQVSVREPGAKSPSTPPLDGTRVLDLTTVWSGPYLTLLLADLGAEVIRIENPSVFPPTTKGYVPRPDADAMHLGSLLSMYGPQVPGRPDRPYNRHAMNNSLARNKLSCTLDPRRPEARELLLRLVEKSDVFVENLKASTLHRLGIHESELMDRNPRMIVLRVPPAGLTGDWASYTGFGAQFDGLSGMLSICGHVGSEVAETPSTTYMDLATGPAGAFAVLAALNYREATGRGQIIELAQLENIVAQLGDVLVDLQLGEEPRRYGNRDPRQAPQGVYRCREDRWLALTVTDDAAWQGLTGVLERPDLAQEPGLAHNAGRYEQHDRLDEAIKQWAGEQEVMAAFHALQSAGVASAPLFDDEQLHNDPNVAARGWIRPLTASDVGTHLHLGHAFQGVPQRWDRGSPALGEDNEYVYREVIGLDQDEYLQLQRSGIAVEDYLDPDGRPV